MQDTEAQTQNHILIARQFLEAADKLFDQEDYVQTSEKLWGAACHALKAVCTRHRWRHGEHAHIREAAKRLTEETGDTVFVTGYSIAYGQRRNFYNDDLEPADIDYDRPFIRELVEKALTLAGQ